MLLKNPIHSLGEFMASPEKIEDYKKTREKRNELLFKAFESILTEIRQNERRINELESRIDSLSG